MSDDKPVVYTTGQFKFVGRNATFYTNIQTLCLPKFGRQKFRGKKKFAIKNPATNVTVEFIFYRVIDNAYLFLSRPSNYQCLIYTER